MAELIQGMLTSSRYKRSQGRIARQLTFWAIFVVIGVMAWRLSDRRSDVLHEFVIPLAVAGAGAWVAFRVVNIPKFADFLISVEAEMNKVSWPSRGELYRASLVVIVVIFLLTSILFVYDLVLKYIVGLFLGRGG